MDGDISVHLIKLNTAKIIGYACRVNSKFQSSEIYQLHYVPTNQMQIIYSSLVKSSSGENQLIWSILTEDGISGLICDRIFWKNIFQI